MKSGIYKITSLINNKIYVGYTLDFDKRRQFHFRELRNNIHKNEHLRNAWNKYGEENFKFDIIEECEKEILAIREHYWCSLLNTHNRKYGYNIRPTDPNKKPAIAEESKKKMSLSGKLKVLTPEHKLRIYQNLKRKVVLKISKDNQILKRWNSVQDCASEVGMHVMYVGKCCRKNKSFEDGFFLTYEEGFNIELKYDFFKQSKSIVCIDGETEKIYPSVNSASKQLEIPRWTLRAILKGKLKHKILKFKFYES